MLTSINLVAARSYIIIVDVMMGAMPSSISVPLFEAKMMRNK